MNSNHRQASNHKSYTRIVFGLLALLAAGLVTGCDQTPPTQIPVLDAIPPPCAPGVAPQRAYQCVPQAPSQPASPDQPPA